MIHNSQSFFNFRYDFENDLYAYSTSSEESEEKENQEKFTKILSEQKEIFNNLKNKYNDLFNYPGIKKDDGYTIYYDAYEVEQDEVIATNGNRPLITKYVGPCICILARGVNKYNETCLGLAHMPDYQNEILSKMVKLFKLYECEENSLQFFLVGGQLPYLDQTGIIESNSLNNQISYLALTEKFNIVGAQLNLVEGAGNSIEILLTKDEIVWTDSEIQFKFSRLTSSEEDEHSNDGAIESLKRKQEETNLPQSKRFHA